MTIDNYLPNTPTKQLPFAKWQIQFQQNFRKLGAAFSQNHIALDNATSSIRGNHTVIEMPDIKNNVPQTSSIEYALYSKIVPEQTAQLYLTFPANTPVVQWTNYQIYELKEPDTYFTFLPGGILVYFGSFTPTSKPFNATFYLNPPIAKNVISIQICTKGTNPQATPSAVMNADQDGIIKSITLGYTFQQLQLPISYIVMANT